MSAYGVYYFFLAKAHNILFFEGSVELWQWVMLMVNGALVSLVVEALHRSQKRIESTGHLHAVTLASIGDAVLTTDNQGRVTFLNMEAERLTEWSHAEAQDQPLAQVFRIVNEKTREPVADPVLKVLQTGLMAGLANHTLLLGRNGKETPIDDSGAPIKEKDGRVAGVVLVFRDCGEKAKAQAQLSQSVSLLRTTIEASSDGLLVVDTAGRVTVYNSRFLEIWKIPTDIAARGDDRPILMLALAQLVEPEEFIRRVKELYAHPDEISFDTLKLKDGRVIERASHPQRLGEKIIGRVWSFQDVTERKNAEQAVLDRERLLRQVIDLVPHFIFAKDRQSRHLFVNRACAEANGLTVETMTGRDDLDFTADKEQAKAYMRDDREVIESGRPKFTPEERFTSKDGTIRILETIKIPFTMPGQNEPALLGVAVDITEKKLAEEKFAREQARFKLIFDTVTIGIAFHTTHSDGSCTRIINDAYLRLCGLSRSQHDEPGIYERITHPDDWAQQQRFQEQIQAGSRKQFSMEKRYLHSPDKVVWVNFSCQRELYPDGTLEELTTVVDITERKAAEQELRQLAVIVESSEDAITGKNLAGIITSWNHGAETMFGYSAGEAVGHAALEFYPPELKNEEADILARISRGESLKHFQTERIRKDGKRIRISATISPLRDGLGNVVGVAAIARDITRQQLLEEQLRQSQKMEAIGQLAGGVAHDFNNILAVIQMQIELSKMEGSLSPEQAGCVDEIQTAANRGANLTRQLLLFSRRQRPQPTELDLSDSITGMTKMLRRVLGEDIQMQFKYAPQPLFLHADAGMMDQLLMNLTLNSRDAMPGGGQLIIETAAVEIDELGVLQSTQARAGSFVRLSVTDTGCGIRPEILPHIFEPFFTTKDVGKGTGLGLATVFSIVQQHQGWINVVSEPDRGTTFDIYLPRLARDSAPPKNLSATLATATGGSETILLVEDDDALRGSVYQCLSQLGYRLLEAASGGTALQIWQQHRDQVHLLLTDLVMPGGMTGKELGDRLQQENPKLKVIYISGYSADIFTRDFPPASGVTFLAKPFAAQALAQTVRTCLDQN